MTEEEKLDLAIDWIRSQGWNEETLPSDELLQMEKAFLAGLDAGKDMAEADIATVAYMQGADSQKKKAEKQLTKAKEILQEYIRINLLPPIERNIDDGVKLFKQAEQFLKK